MTKKLTRILSALVAVAAISGIVALTVNADTAQPTVTYDAKANTFSFANADPYVDETNPDLFPDLKDLYPGDERTEKISVAVKNVPARTTVNLYVEADFDEEKNPNAHDQNEDHAALMEDDAIVLRVTHDNETYSGTLDDRSGNNRILLGEFTQDGTTEMDVTLSIPLSAGEEIMGKVAKVGWKFTAECFNKEVPSGGDNSKPPELNTEDHYAYIIGYEDGTVRPSAPITRAEVATIFFRLLTDESRAAYWRTDNPYPDVTVDNWFNNGVSTLSNAGIIKGYTDGTFKPNNRITRAEFATIASRFFTVEDVMPASFSDISGHWAEDYINRAASAGIILGYEDGTFRPDQDITRAEAMTIINRVIGRRPHKDHLLPDMVVWSDNMDTSAWYYEQVQEATNSHDYDMMKPAAEKAYEIWKAILPVRDWAAYDDPWSTPNSASGGEVMD